jgi:bleomycin hydrolase
MKIRFSLLALVVLALALPLFAQYTPTPGEEPSPKGALTPEMLETLRQSTVITPQLKAVQNALAENEINVLVTDRQKTIADDTLFTKEIKTGKITNQEQSGRCWLFGGLNALKPDIMKKYGLDNFELSQAYSQFWDKLERANRSLELAIALKNEPSDSRKNMLLLQKPIEDGGDWNFVRFLVNRYGAVPKSVMPDTQQAGHTDQMNKLLSTVMRKGIKSVRGADTPEAVNAAKMNTLKDVYKVLVLCLGQPPQTFQWRYENKNKDKDADKDKEKAKSSDKVKDKKDESNLTALQTFTPQSFYKEFMGSPLDNYISFVNYPGKPENTVIRFSWNRDSSDGPDMQALNISTAQMQKIALASIMDNQVVWFCCNSSVQRNTKTGLWDMGIQDFSGLFGIDFTMSKEDQLRYYDGAPNHCMVLTGVDVQNGIPVKWKVENSWGDKRGREGWWTITQSWFDANIFEILIDKKYCPPELLKAAEQEPIVMPPWDPFSN